MKKICRCKQKNALYNDIGVIKCQYCMGEITDKKRLKIFSKYNHLKQLDKTKQ